LDEDYICEIYRPLFGERSPLAGDAMADVMDKALQWDVERDDCRDAAKVDEIRVAMVEAAIDVNVDFIARETLLQWRDISVDLIGTPPSVERLVRFLGRRMPDFRFDDDEAAARFAAEIPALLKRTWEHVGVERIQEYLHGARSRARATMKEYLS
jgi:hypothetical protein